MLNTARTKARAPRKSVTRLEYPAIRTRLTLDLNQNQSNRLAELEVQTGCTKAALVREALALYDYVAELARAGKEFHAVDPKGTSEKVVLLSLRQ
ncbi:MAG: hypothetical protein NTZ56_18665 [Acidobacteria bacterium]|nr:hypothetical protein [Acidobacteriota bacterium]